MVIGILLILGSLAGMGGLIKFIFHGREDNDPELQIMSVVIGAKKKMTEAASEYRDPFRIGGGGWY